jgi:hypothetical protein
MRPIEFASNDTVNIDADPHEASPPRGVSGVLSKVIEFGLASVGTFVIVWALATVTVLMIAR